MDHKQDYRHGDSGISDIECGYPPEVYPVDHPPVEKAVSTENSIDEVADGSPHDQAEGDHFESRPVNSQGPGKRSRDGDRSYPENRAGILEEPKGSPGILGVGKGEKAWNDLNGVALKLDRCPAFGQGINDHDSRRQPDSDNVSADQAIRAQSTQSVTYGKTSRRASGMLLPQLSQIP